jgi:hypothetical protein
MEQSEGTVQWLFGKSSESRFGNKQGQQGTAIRWWLKLPIHKRYILPPMDR